MSDGTDEGDLPDRLIDELQAAQRDRRNARNVMTAVIAAVVVVYVFLGIKEVNDFQDEELDEFGSALAIEITDLAPQIGEDLGEAFNRLGPVYQEAFVKVFQRDEERYYEVLSDEYIDLQRHAHGAWPKIEEALATLVIEQEDNAREELSRVLDEDMLTEMSIHYNRALEEYLTQYFEGKFAINLDVSEAIIDKLTKIAESENELNPTDSQYTLGLMLELLGLEMQNAAVHEAVFYLEEAS